MGRDPGNQVTWALFAKPPGLQDGHPLEAPKAHLSADLMLSCDGSGAIRTALLLIVWLSTGAY